MTLNAPGGAGFALRSSGVSRGEKQLALRQQCRQARDGGESIANDGSRRRNVGEAASPLGAVAKQQGTNGTRLANGQPCSKQNNP